MIYIYIHINGIVKHATVQICKGVKPMGNIIYYIYNKLSKNIYKVTWHTEKGRGGVGVESLPLVSIQRKGS